MAFVGLGINLQQLPVSTIAVELGWTTDFICLVGLERSFGEIWTQLIHQAIATAGHATVVTGLIIIIGVIFWNFSSIKFQADMGPLFSLVTLFHLSGTMILLPAMIKIMRPKFIMKEFVKKGGEMN